MSEDNRNKARFAIYAFAGVYLLYLAWQLFQNLGEAGAYRAIMIAAIIAFTLIGGAAVIGGVYVSGKQMKERYDAQLEYEKKKRSSRSRRKKLRHPGKIQSPENNFTIF